MKTVPLDAAKHNRQQFDCGISELNTFLQRTANQQSVKDNSRTYVLEDEQQSGIILGFYTLTMVQFELSYLPQNLQKRHRATQSAGLIARLAVDINHQGKGYGGLLLHNALVRLYHASESVGFPVVFVDAKDGKKEFYEYYGFQEAAGNRMFITIASIRNALSDHLTTR